MGAARISLTLDSPSERHVVPACSQVWEDVPYPLKAARHIVHQNYPMKTNQRFQLIDGTFIPSEAGKVLLSLVKSKIDYHSLEQFSNEVRFGGDVANSEKRLEKLRNVEVALKELLALAGEEKQDLKIDAWIEVSFVSQR